MKKIQLTLQEKGEEIIVDLRGHGRQMRRAGKKWLSLWNAECNRENHKVNAKQVIMIEALGLIKGTTVEIWVDGGSRKKPSEVWLS